HYYASSLHDALPILDGLLHRVGNKSMEIPFKLRLYEQRMERLMAVAREHYAQVRLYIFSDHGMANCNEFLDLQAQIDKLGLQMRSEEHTSELQSRVE